MRLIYENTQTNASTKCEVKNKKWITLWYFLSQNGLLKGVWYNVRMNRRSQNPLVTIIIPVYNGERFLRPLLESVKAQTFSDWVCVCVDDGSTDGSRPILNEFVADDTRFVVIIQKNAGCGAARNTAISQSQSDFVMFADQDDILHPRCLECAVSLIARAEADAVCFKAVPFQAEYVPEVLSTDLSTISLVSRTLPPHEQFVKSGTGCSIFVWRHIFKRVAIADVPFPPLSGGEDAVWMVELGWRGVQIVDVDVELYGNRHHAASGSRGLSRHYIDNVFRSYIEIRSRGERYGINPLLLKRFLFRLAFWFVASAFYHGFKSGFYALKLFLRGNW